VIVLLSEDHLQLGVIGITLNYCDNNTFRTYDTAEDARFRSLLTCYDNSKGPPSHKSHIFVDKYTLPPHDDIVQQAYKSIEIENAGGQSEISELYSIDYFARNYNADEFIFEEEVKYWIQYKMVDFICTINGERVGVSVARAMGYPTPDRFTLEHARRLLLKKLTGLIVARNAVIKSQSFFKSVLHIWCQSSQIAMLLHEAFENLDDNDYGLDIKGVLLLQLTVCDDTQLYKNVLTR
jgi:hypothetical protein